MTDTNNIGDKQSRLAAILERATPGDMNEIGTRSIGAKAMGLTLGSAGATTQGQSLQYNTVSNKITRGDGTSFGADDVTDESVDWSAIDLPDPGYHIPAERARLAREVTALEAKVNAIDGYDRAGKPIYSLHESDRERLRVQVEGMKRQQVEANKELDRLEAQRSRREQQRQAASIADAHRDARVSQYAAEALERMEGEERARAMLNRKNGGSY